MASDYASGVGPRATEGRGAVWISDTPSIPGLTLIRTDGFTANVPRQFYDRCVFTLVREGCGRVKYRGTWLTFPRGAAFILRPGETVEGASERKAALILHIDPGVLAGYPGADPRAGLELGAPAVGDAVRRVFEVTAVPRPQLELDSEIQDALATLVRGGRAGVGGERRREAPGVRRAREFIDAHFTAEIPLRELARASGLNASYLNRVFRVQLGIPPHEYQLVRRVRRAGDLILAGCSIADAAAAVGFFDQSHLARHWVRVLGFTPGAYTRAPKGQRRTRGSPPMEVSLGSG